MSLAQKIERLQPGSDKPVAAPPRIAVPVDFRDITRRSPAPAAPSPITIVPPEPAPSVRQASEVALDLLGEVSKALPFLMARCQQLEVDLIAAQETARADVETANEVAREWQQIAGALKLQVDGLEKGLKVMKQRAEAAEERVAALREETDRSQHAAAEAECLSSLFQEKVISSFGSNSLMHPILEAFRGKPVAAVG